MRQIVGWGLLGVGVVGLGLWGRGDHAQDIEASIAAAAQDAVAGTVYPVAVDVKGRDIRVSGTAASESEKEALLTLLNAVDGQRVIVDGLVVIEQPDPYALSLVNDGATLAATGHVPSANIYDGLVFQGVNPDNLALGAGAPEGFGVLAKTVSEGLSTLEVGEAQMQGTSVRIEGVALYPEIRARLLEQVASLSEGFETDISIDVLDDGAPFSLDVSYEDGQANASGKLPLGLELTNLLTPLAPQLVTGTVTTARIGEGHPFGAMAASGVNALSFLENGALVLSGDVGRIEGEALFHDDRESALAEISPYDIAAEITVLDDGSPLELTASLKDRIITGAGKVPSGMSLYGVNGSFMRGYAPDDAGFGIAAIEGLGLLRALERGDLVLKDQELQLTGDIATAEKRDALMEQAARLPEGFTTNIDLNVLDDGQPFTLFAALEGGVVTGTGKLPSGSLLPQVRGDFEIAAIGAQDSFKGATDIALNALRLMESGTLDVSNGTVSLSGEVADPDAAEAIAAALAELPAGWSASQDFTLLDDGSPIAYTAQYSVTEGVSLAGKAPIGFTADSASDALDFDEVTAANLLQARKGGDPAKALELLSKLSPLLPVLDAFTLEGTASDASLSVQAAGGVDLAQLSALLPEGTTVRAGNVPQEGAERTNLRTGALERYRGVAWIPVATFEADAAACTQSAQDVLAQTRINFLSGSANLDARSIAVINQIAGIATHCAQAGLMLEVGGHTDSTGSAEGNQRLSGLRAETVANSLTARGVPAEGLTAIGFGQSEPVASNDTEEGRAENRRTTFVWRAASQEQFDTADEETPIIQDQGEAE